MSVEVAMIHYMVRHIRTDCEAGVVTGTGDKLDRLLRAVGK
jgi:hypothetical protein